MKQHASPVGRRSPEAVCVANRQDGYTRRRLCYVSTAVADALLCRYYLDLRHLGFERERGTEVPRDRYFCRGIKSIERNSWPYHIKMSFCQTQQRRTVGSMDKRWAQSLPF